MEKRAGQRSDTPARLAESSANEPPSTPTPTPRLELRSQKSPPPPPPHTLLTCPALKSLKSLQLHRHHHAIEAAKVCGGHHAPVEGRDGGKQGFVLGGAVMEKLQPEGHSGPALTPKPLPT